VVRSYKGEKGHAGCFSVAFFVFAAKSPFCGGLEHA